MRLENIFGPVICRYTRREAIDDGLLTDVTAEAQEAGIKFPVAFTQSLSQRISECASDENLVTWDVILGLVAAIRRNTIKRNPLTFFVLMDSVFSEQYSNVQLTAECHGGDAGEPVITVTLDPDEF